MAAHTEIELMFGLLIAVGIPVVSYMSHLRDLRLRAAGTSASRQKIYRSTLIMLWIPTSLLLFYWLNSDNSFATLGLGLQLDSSALWGWVFVTASALFLVVQLWAVKTKETAARQMLQQMEGVPAAVQIMPDTWSIYKNYALIALTAGITEEIMFRGFLTWFFLAWTPLWAAAILALIPFIMSHLYQQKAIAIAQVAGLGMLLTAVYVLSGSLWPAIVLHIIVDLAAGASYLLAKEHVEKLESTSF